MNQTSIRLLVLLGVIPALSGCISYLTEAGGPVPVHARKVMWHELRSQTQPASEPIGRIVLLRFYSNKPNEKPDPVVVEKDGQEVCFPKVTVPCSNVESFSPSGSGPTLRWTRRGVPQYSVWAFAPGCWPWQISRKSNLIKEYEYPDPDFNDTTTSHWIPCDEAPRFSEGSIYLSFHPRSVDCHVYDGFAPNLLKNTERLAVNNLSSLSNDDCLLIYGQLLDALQQYAVSTTLHDENKNMKEVRAAIFFIRGEAKKVGLQIVETDASCLAIVKALCEKEGIKAASREWLRLAAFEGWAESLEYLLHNGANPDDDKGYFSPPLHIAICANQVQAVEILLHHGADPNRTNTWGKSPITLAVACGNIEIVKTLLEHGADLAVTDKYGKRPADYAAVAKEPELVKLLQQCAATRPTVMPSSASDRK